MATISNGACALVDGGVWCWGMLPERDDAGMLNAVATPVLKAGLESGVTLIAGGLGTYCAIRNGDLFCWGTNGAGQLAHPVLYETAMVQIAGLDGGVSHVGHGQQTVCAVVRNEAWCWGDNRGRQVDPAVTTNFVLAPRKVQGVGSDVIFIAGGEQSTCALKGLGTTRSVMCWGTGILGDGNGRITRPAPVQVATIGGDVKFLAVGTTHFCALVNGEVRCWGNNFARQIPGHPGGEVLYPIPITLQ